MSDISSLYNYAVPVERTERYFKQEETQEVEVGQPTFLDVFNSVLTDAVDTNQQKSEDMIRLMLGDADDIEQIQLNIQKAEVATELLVNVKNAVVDAYNEIARMNI